MGTIKSVFVTGATGNQGGSVVRHLVNNGYHVRALVRDPESHSAQGLRKLPLEIIKGDLNDVASYRDNIKGMDAVYSMQTFTNGIKKEIAQGIGLTDVAKDMGVQHFVYSSVIGADLNTGVPHWESKKVIEQHIKKTGISHTIIRPNSFYENFLFPQVKNRILKGKLVIPVRKEVVQQYLSADDIGMVVNRILGEPETFRNEVITIAAEQMDQGQAAEVFSNILGKEIRYQQLPSIITRLAMGGDLYKMFRWVDKNDCLFVKDMPAVKQRFPGMESLADWIRRKFN